MVTEQKSPAQNTKIDLPEIEGFPNVCERADGESKMIFTRLVLGDEATQSRTAESGSTMIYAYGSTTDLTFHGPDNGVFILEGDAIVPKAPAVLWLHMFFMVLAWGLLLPFGVQYARFNRNTKPPGYWFKVHQACQYTGWTLQLAGFICIVYYVQETGVHFSGPNQGHMIIGLIVFILGFLQPVNAAFRPHPDPPSSARAFWEYLHKGSGYTAVFFGAVNVIVGVYVASAKSFVTLMTVSAVLCGVFLGSMLIMVMYKMCTAGGKEDPPTTASSKDTSAAIALTEETNVAVN